MAKKKRIRLVLEQNIAMLALWVSIVTIVIARLLQWPLWIQPVAIAILILAPISALRVDRQLMNSGDPITRAEKMLEFAFRFVNAGVFIVFFLITLLVSQTQKWWLVFLAFSIGLLLLVLWSYRKRQ